MSAIMKVYIWEPNKFGEDVLKTLFHNSSGSRYFVEDFRSLWSLQEEKEADEILRKKYGKTSDQIVMTSMPSFRCVDIDKITMNKAEKYFEVFDGQPFLITEEFIAKFDFDKKLQKFLKDNMKNGNEAFKIVW